jgi:hypothetical protein
MKNIDEQTVKGFWDEWERFFHSDSDKLEMREIFDDYFSIVDFGSLSKKSVVADVVCGSGRWAKIIVRSIFSVFIYLQPTGNIAKSQTRAKEK